MHDDPLGAQALRGIDIGFEIALDRVADLGRIFGDIDGRRGMQSKTDIVPLASRAHRGGARFVDRAERVGAGIELHIDEPHLVPRGPSDRLFERQFAADIDTDALAQIHRGHP
jgi:hypothetical protein